MVRNMTEGSPMKLIVAFTIPLLIGNLFQQFYNIADIIIVGRFIGVHALAAVGATAPLFMGLLALTIGLASGFTVITAHDSLVEELRTDLAFRTACLNLKVHYAYWPYDRLYVAESSAPYGHNQEKVKADKDFNSRSEHWTV